MGNACSVLVIGSSRPSLDRNYRTPSFMLEVTKLNKVYGPMLCKQTGGGTGRSMHEDNS
jgi:hypothetical protein